MKLYKHIGRTNNKENKKMLMPHHRAIEFIERYPDLEMTAQRLKDSDLWLIVIDQEDIPQSAKDFIKAHATYYYERQLDLDLPLTASTVTPETPEELDDGILDEIREALSDHL